MQIGPNLVKCCHKTPGYLDEGRS